MSTAKIPVTVLTGFLGSGKTTLLNRILSESHGLRIAVIENEFGEIGVDQDLVINAEEEIFEMNNGCICCTVRGDLIRILNSLSRRRDKFDRVILETTGLADPGPVAQTFFVDGDIRGQYTLDGVITLVDAKHVTQHLDEESEALAQIAFADRILLNKIDLVDADSVAELRKRIHGINAMAKLLPVHMANAPLHEVLDVGGFDLDRALETRPGFLEPEYPFEWAGLYQLRHGNYVLKLDNGPDPEMSVFLLAVEEPSTEVLLAGAELVLRQFAEAPRVLESHQHLPCAQHVLLKLAEKELYCFNLSLIKTGYYALFAQHTAAEFNLELMRSDGTEQTPLLEHLFNAAHEHNDEVTSVAFEYPGELHEKLFDAWIGSLLRTQGNDIFRTKGIVNFQGSSHRYILQGVHMLMDGKPGEPWGNEPRFNRLVLIGRNLDRSALAEEFKQCFV
jgi:G3E family GTPase